MNVLFACITYVNKYFSQSQWAKFQMAAERFDIEDTFRQKHSLNLK